MPSVDVDTPIQDCFPSTNLHVNQSEPCLVTSRIQDSSPSYSISSVSSESKNSKRLQESFSFLPPTVYRSEQTEYSGQQAGRPLERTLIYVSPFRSVRRMKEPFPLVLPTSPSFESSVSNRKETKTLQSPIGMRDLRHCRSDQHLAPESPDFLPNPRLSGSHASDAFPSTSCISPKRNVDICQTSVTNTCACTPGSRVKGGSPSTDSSETGMSCEASSKPKKRTRTDTISSEASWMPGSLSYFETWLQGVPMESPGHENPKSKEANRRKFQIVQHGCRPLDLRIDTQTANESVRFATVASKTKPKLVDISRPSSSATSYSVPIQLPPSWKRPSTPDQHCHEISAFSPDTPLDIPDSGYVTQHSNHSSEDNQVAKDEGTSIDMVPQIQRSVSVSSGVSSSSLCGNTHFLQSQTPLPENPDAFSPDNERGSKLRTSPPVSPHMVDREVLEKWWDHEWTLDRLEASVNNFPASTLKLTSPVIIYLRQNDDTALLRPFLKIFPGISEELLDSLCAVLVARNYLVSLASVYRRNSALSQSNILSRLDSVPEKARATLGLQWPSASQLQVTERLMGSRTANLRKDLDRIVDELMLMICGRSDETLKTAVVVLVQVLEAKA